jgi:3-phytase
MPSIRVLSLLLAGALGGCHSTAPVRVSAFAESAPVASADDAADDPAIWLHPHDPSLSVVFGSDKDQGFYGYDLTGRIRQREPFGRLNNIDIVQGVRFGDRSYDIMGASNRSDDTIAFFHIAPETGTAQHLFSVPTGKTEPYGFCLGRDGEDLLAAVPYKDGEIRMFRISGVAVVASLPSITVRSVSEGCVFDEQHNALYVSEEAVGLWRFALSEGRETSRRLVDRVGSSTGLTADVEGVTLWTQPGSRAGYLIVSAQAANRFIVYDRASPNRFRGAFTVGGSAQAGTDSVTHTDGIASTSAYLGPALPAGVFIAQDDSNAMPSAPQNFKFVDWREIQRGLNLE